MRAIIPTERNANADIAFQTEEIVMKGDSMEKSSQCVTCRFGGHREKCCMAQGGTPKYTEGERCPLYAMSAQAFMQRATHAQRRIVCMEERAARFRDMATRITGGMQTAHVQGAQGGSRVEDGMTAFMDICRDIEEEAQRLRGYLRQANAVIARLADQDEREVLELRYLSGYGWEDIAQRMFVNERTARRIQVRALEHVQREMDVMEYAVHRPGWNPGGMGAQYVQ